MFLIAVMMCLLLPTTLLTSLNPTVIIGCMVGLIALTVAIGFRQRPPVAVEPSPPHPNGNVIEVIGPEDDPEFVRRMRAQIQRQHRDGNTP